MYTHNVDALLYGVVYYAMLTVAVNLFLWTMSSNTAYACT